MTKSAESLLVISVVGAIATVLGSMPWAGVARVAATFTQIAPVVQVNP